MNNVEKLVRTSFLLAIAIVFQFLGRNIPQINQLFVGPIVNAILILTVYLCGIKWGVLTGILTPVLAWIIGQLAAPLAPFIPFIAVGNALYVVVFGILKEYKFGIYLGIIIGALVKFIFLFLSASKLVHVLELNIPTKITSKLVVSMGIPQFITAIIGGIIAVVLIRILLERKIIHKSS